MKEFPDKRQNSSKDVTGYEYHMLSDISPLHFIDNMKWEYERFRFRNNMLNLEYECKERAIDNTIRFLINTPETLFERIFKRGERERTLNSLYKQLTEVQEEYYKKLSNLS